MTLYSIVMVLCSTMAQLGDPAIPTTKGRVISVAEDTVTIAVRAGEEPVLGDKIEIYIELPDLDGIAVLATGRVTQVTETSAIARLESKTGRIGKNQLVRVTPSKLARSSNKPIADTVSEPMPTPSPSTGRPPVPAPINADLTRAVGTALPAPLPENLGLGGVKGRPLNSLSSEPTNGDFAAPVRSFQQAVLRIGNPARGAWGTGFVISRAKRWVATNAHVADIAKIAVLNESRTSYKVEKIWYHGGVIRFMDDGKTLIQSANPADGEVDTECSDIAILKLEAVGPDLPAEVVLASPEETFGIMGSRVGILGYPGYQHDQFIQPDVFASATFVQGSVSRMTGLRHVPNAAMVQRQSVAYDARTYGGFSGSPVFLSNGRVVAVHNHSHRDAGERTLAQGLRVDVLWELLHREKLCDCVSGEPLGLPEQIAFTLAPDPRVEKLRRAQRQLAQSADLILHDEFEEAQHILKDAKLLLPDYWRLYWQSSRNITHYLADEWEDLPVQNKTSW
ncbi:MAG: trypsin-like peptidase domain-containing protein, partial [Pirellulales bacterium]|nr:trypsin-like peptidase domain-containing protein [Pirellulales bacterium]